MTYVLQLASDPHFAYGNGLLRSLPFHDDEVRHVQRPRPLAAGPVYVHHEPSVSPCMRARGAPTYPGSWTSLSHCRRRWATDCSRSDGAPELCHGPPVPRRQRPDTVGARVREHRGVFGTTDGRLLRRPGGCWWRPLATGPRRATVGAVLLDGPFSAGSHTVAQGCAAVGHSWRRRWSVSAFRRPVRCRSRSREELRVPACGTLRYARGTKSQTAGRRRPARAPRRDAAGTTWRARNLLTTAAPSRQAAGTGAGRPVRCRPARAGPVMTSVSSG